MERSVASVGSRAATGYGNGRVLANPVDVAYPLGHASISETLAKDQLIVSELPPAAHPPRVRFPDPKSADRWSVSRHFGLEPALRSCARNNAGWALACGRPHGGAGSGVLHDHSLLTGEDQQL
jgi:DNA processing protein